jgi:alcohol dehydrogenase class IV
MRFEFATATRIVFGAGALCDIGRAAKEMGHRALLVSGRPQNCAAPLVEQLSASGLTCSHFVFGGEPTLGTVQEGIRQARSEACDLVIGFGGGSSIDAAKAVSAMLTNEGDLLDYLEVIGKSKPLSSQSAPCIAVPTTAGTGAEVTRNAVLASPEHRFKASLRSPLMLPRLALVDPELTYDLPAAVTASTGLDALTQLIEPYVSCRANPMTDSVCREGMNHAAQCLRRAFLDGRDLEARTGMALASLMSGLALANAGLGIVHGFAAPIGGMFAAPHGAVCAALLPHGMKINIRALQNRLPGSEALQRYQTIARVLTRKAHAGAEDGAQWVSELCRSLGIAPLRSYGVSEGDVPDLVEKASRASSTKGNPIALLPDELAEMITLAL